MLVAVPLVGRVLPVLELQLGEHHGLPRLLLLGGQGLYVALSVGVVREVVSFSS